MIHINFKFLLVGALSLCSFTGFSQAGFDTGNASSILDGSALTELEYSGDHNRGFSFNSTHVYVADRQKVVTYYEIGTANSGSLDVTGITGGTLHLFDVVATESGVLGSNLALGNADGTAKLKIYKWADHSSAPTVLLEFTAPNGSRLGEEFTFSGSANGDGTLHVLDRNSSNAYIWTVVGGAIADQASPTIINFAGLSNPGATPNINAVYSAGVKYWLVDGFSIAPVLYSEDGQTALTSLTGGNISSSRIGKDIVEFNNKRYYITTKGNTGAGIEVYDISGGDLATAFNTISPSTKVYTSAFNANANANANGITHIETHVDNVNNEVHVLSGSTNNGFEFVKIPGNRSGLDFSSITSHFNGSSLTELDFSGNSNRGFSMNSTHAYVAANTKAWYFDHSDPNATGTQLSLGTAVTQGFYGLKLADVFATDNGILGSNIAGSNTAGANFDVYRWADNTADPDLILSFDNGAHRLGDHINFVGDPQGNGTLYAMAYGGNTVYKWDMANGTIADQANPTTITFADLTNAGNYGHVQPVSSDGVDYLLVNGTNMPPTLYSADGQTKLTSISSAAIGNRAIGGNVLEFNNERYLIVTYVGSEGSTTRDAGVLVYDISGYDLINAFNAISVNSTNLVYSGSYGDAVNGNQSGDVQFVVDNCNDDNVYILSGAANNGFEILSTGGFSRGLDFDNPTVHFDGSSLTELDFSGNSNRGFSMNSTHAYVAANTKAWYFDHSDPNATGTQLSLGTAVTQGFYGLKLADVFATDNGILGSNIAGSNTAGANFDVYRWADNTADPDLILSFDNGAHRLGDHINFVGDPQGNGTLYAMAYGGNTVYKWDMANGTIADQANPTTITFADLTNAGNYGHVQPVSSDGVDYLLVNGTNMPPTLYSADGQTKLTSISSAAIGNRAIGGEVIEYNYGKYLVLTTVGSEGSTTRDAGVLVYDISSVNLVDAMNSINAESASCKLVFSDSYGQAVNGNQAGDVKLIVDSANDTVFMMSGAANNGFKIVKFGSDPSTLSIDNDIEDVDSINLIRVYPNPTSNRIFIQSSSEVKSSIYNISGRKMGVYYSKEIDMSSFNNGIYIIDIESEDLSTNKTFKVIKQ